MLQAVIFNATTLVVFKLNVLDGYLLRTIGLKTQRLSNMEGKTDISA